MLNKKFSEGQEELNQQLLKAIKSNDLSDVKAAVEAGALVNKDGHSYIPLLDSKKLEITKYLLECGADVNVCGGNGNTFLHNAVSDGLVDHVNLFLKYKANMYAKNYNGETPYALSFKYGQMASLECLLSNGYIPSKEDLIYKYNYELFEGIKHEDLPAVKEAVEAGADVNTIDGWGYPALNLSAPKDIVIMRYLLEKGADPNIKDYIQYTPLQYTACLGHLEKVKLLLKYKADMSMENYNNNTPFVNSLLREHYEIAELFVLNGYIPAYEDFHFIEDKTKRKSLRTHFRTLLAQVQEQKHKLGEEAKAQKFAYADEIMEM